MTDPIYNSIANNEILLRKKFKEVKDLYSQKYRKLIKEIEDDK